MGRSKETFGKKEVRNKQAKKRKDKEKKRLEKKEQGGKKKSFDDMIAWVDENGMICSEPPDLSNKTEIDAESIEVGIPKSEERDNNKLQRGRVNNFDHSKGFGFIMNPQTRDSIFVHINDCADEIDNGDEVEFETEKGMKGLKAINVKRVK